MRKKILFGRAMVFVLLILFTTSCEKNVDNIEAGSKNVYTIEANIAKNIAEEVDIDKLAGINLKTKVEREIENIEIIFSDEGFINFYIINFKDEKGFIVISGDRRVMPILAFSYKGNFRSEDNRSGIKLWVSNNKKYFREIRESKLHPDKDVEKMWQTIARIEPMEPSDPTDGGDSGGGGSNDPEIISNVTKGPLLNTTWSQGCDFNDFCPTSNISQYCYHCLTGCPATAIAQIFRYHEYPNNYSWNQMLNNVGTIETAQLMYNIGVAIGTGYGATSSGISNYQFENNLEGILENSFGYSSSVDYIDYDGNDYNTVKSEIDYNRPVLFKGMDGSSGHAWVCDGYIRTVYTTYSTLYFHMNWGWSYGDANGWFAYNSFDPTTSSGNHYDFDEDIGCIIGIKP